MTTKIRITHGARRGTAATALALALLAALSACEAIDPTRINNPTTTDDDLAGANDPTAALVPGLRAQFARMINAYVSAAEVVSDNYSIHGTGINQDMDDPSAVTSDLVNGTGTASSGVYWNVQSLKALSDFVLNDIVPTDPDPPAALVAEASYYRGMAYLTMGEVFSYAPHEEDGPAMPAAEALSNALRDLAVSRRFSIAASSAAEARAHRLLGNAQAAETAAALVLDLDPSYLHSQEYDAQTISNTPVAFLVLRALQEMQPLPRLDFLDPKYTEREAAIAVAKAEEMHLILAEVDLAAGNLEEGRAHLVDAINTAGARGTTEFDDNDERRNADLTFRPRSSEILVRSDADSPYRAGLVLDRPAEGLMVPTVSATSLDADSVAGLSDAPDLWHALWLARQEMLFLEGRRLADLGIKLPMMLREIDQNPEINTGDPGTETMVPSWIPLTPLYAMDLYSPKELYDSRDLDAQLVETRVTIGVDMNRVLVENDASPFR